MANDEAYASEVEASGGEIPSPFNANEHEWRTE